MACNPEQTRRLQQDDPACEGGIEAQRCIDRSRWRLLAAPMTLAFVDLALTLQGQTSQYWSGDYSAVLESNPLAHLFLASIRT